MLILEIALGIVLGFFIIIIILAIIEDHNKYY